MTVAFDFWKSKTFITAVISTVIGAIWVFGMEKRQPTKEEVSAIVALWMAVFAVDSSKKNAEVVAGTRDPITKEPTINLEN